MQEHYSYTIYRRRDVADRFDEDRFGGPIGELINEWEEDTVLAMLDTGFEGTEIHNVGRDTSLDGIDVLDVGAGTGRISFFLTRRGAHVTGIDSSGEMLKKAEEKANAGGVSVNFMAGDAHELPFEDKSFDYVVSLRTLMHVVDWEKVLGEMCRAARKGVIFDFPPLMSVVFLAPLIMYLKRKIVPDTQVYRVFVMSSIRRVLARNNFHITGIRRHFVLPVFVHRKLRQRVFSEKMENLLAVLGLRSLFGAPVVVKAVREGDKF